MKKLKLDRKSSGKIILLALSTTLTSFALTGCESQKSLLDGTILENTRVITFTDGHIDIAKEINDEYLNGNSHEHNHYKSIITDEVFTLEGCSFSSISYKYEVEDDTSIVAYLTVDELEKAAEENLTSDDVKNIIVRVFKEYEEKTNDATETKTKTLTK